MYWLVLLDKDLKNYCPDSYSYLYYFGILTQFTSFILENFKHTLYFIECMSGQKKKRKKEKKIDAINNVIEN